MARGQRQVNEKAVAAAMVRWGDERWGRGWRLIDAASEKTTRHREDLARATVTPLVQAAAPDLKREERDRIHAALKEQAEEYRREAGEAHRRGDQGGWEKLTAAQSVVACVTRIIFEPTASTPQPADQQEGEHRG